MIALLAAALLLATPASPTCAPATLPIDGHQIWAQARGAGATTVVFEAGFGNDSSVWAAIEPRVRATGVRTLVYDRAGMGQSTIDTGRPYSLVNGLRVSETLPIIDIVAEKGRTDPESDRAWRAAHQAFTAGHPARAQVLAEGSGHKVMADKPDLVVDEILSMLKRVGAPR